MEKRFRTLRGFIKGSEPEEPAYFAYSASLRIFGDNLDFEEITNNIGIQPTLTHRKGDKKGPNSPGFKEDLWCYNPKLTEDKPLEEHINALWHSIKGSMDYLLLLKQRAKVDVFLGYRSNIDHAGFEIPHTCLEMFVRLEIPFGMSIIIA